MYSTTGESLLTGNEPKWSRTRRLLTPAFHFDVLKPYVKVYCECVDILLVSEWFTSVNMCQRHSRIIIMDMLELYCTVRVMPYYMLEDPKFYVHLPGIKDAERTNS